jgi:uncharacterized membrane protein
MKRAARLALNLATLGVTTVAARVAQRKSSLSTESTSDRDPSNLTLLGLGLLALMFGYRK